MISSKIKENIFTKEIKVPLFDIDWTLLKGGNKIYSEAFDFAFRTVYKQPSVSKKDIVTHGMVDTQIIIDALKVHGVSEKIAKEKMDKALNAIISYYNKHSKKEDIVLMPGAKKLLERLYRSDVPAGLLTGNIENIAWKKAKDAGIKKYLSFGAFGSQAYKRENLVKIAKNNAMQYLGINIPIKKFVIIGDSPGDIDCARKNKIKSIAVVSHNYSRGQLKKAGADLVVDSLKNKKILKFLGIT